MPDYRKIRGTMAFACPVVVFIKSNIKHPVQVVLNGPVCPNRMFRFAGVVCTETAEKITRLFANLIIQLSFGGSRNNALSLATIWK